MSDEFQRPRTGKIRTASQYSGLSRSTLYEMAPRHDGLFLKAGKSTLVDFGKLDEILDQLPAAKIRPPRKTDKT
jgi:hypothetical protein